MKSHLLLLLCMAVTVMNFAVLPGCVTVDGYAREARSSSYGGAPLPYSPATPPDQQQVQLHQYRQASRRPMQETRPHYPAHDYVALDTIVLPRGYAQGRRNTFTEDYLSALLDFYGQVYGLDPYLIAAVIKAESNFNPYAVSPCGARGLMQLMPATAKSLGVVDCFDPAQNIAGGSLYLAKQLRDFGDLSLALAAYNAGPGNVRKHGGIPPNEKTKVYVQRVNRYYQHYAGK